MSKNTSSKEVWKENFRVADTSLNSHVKKMGSKRKIALAIETAPPEKQWRDVAVTEDFTRNDVVCTVLSESCLGGSRVVKTVGVEGCTFYFEVKTVENWRRRTAAEHFLNIQFPKFA